MISLLSPGPWPDYELLDAGNGEKLERFGAYTLQRPEPQALWEPTLPPAQWENRADAVFRKEKGSAERGQWQVRGRTPDRWTATYPLPDGGGSLSYRLGLSAFKHVGLFPEQAVNWDFIFRESRKMQHPRVLNLFAYTGLASLAAARAGATVTHVDAVRQVISWARDNMELSGLDGIRWVVEDALKFVRREGRRGNRYQGIILDPPAYGRGPDGEKWVLEEQISGLLKEVQALLDPQGHFMVLNLYSLNFSSLIADQLVRRIFGVQPQYGELFLPDAAGQRLPLGIFARYSTVKNQ